MGEISIELTTYTHTSLVFITRTKQLELIDITDQKSLFKSEQYKISKSNMNNSIEMF